MTPDEARELVDRATAHWPSVADVNVDWRRMLERCPTRVGAEVVARLIAEHDTRPTGRQLADTIATVRRILAPDPRFQVGGRPASRQSALEHLARTREALARSRAS